MVADYYQALNRLLITVLLLWSTEAVAQVTWPNEPSGTTVLTDWPFSALSGSGWEDQLPNASCRIVADATAPLSPSNVLEQYREVGTQAGCQLAFNFVQPMTELYIGVRYKASNPFWGMTNLLNKVFMLMDQQGGTIWNEINGQSLNQNPAGTDVYLSQNVNNCQITQGFGDCPWQGAGAFVVMGNGTPVSLGEWHTWEVYIKKSSSSLTADGILRWWIDGVQQANVTNMRNPDVGWVTLFITPAWDSVNPQQETDDYHRFDHIRISAGNCPPSGCVSPTPDWPNEPSGATTLLDWAFNTVAGSGLTDASGRGTIVSDATAQLSPVNVLRSRLQNGIAPGGVSLMYQLDDLSEVFAGVWWKPNTDFQGISSGINPLFYLPVAQSAGHFAWIGTSDVTALSGQIGFAMTAGTGVLNNCHLLGWQGNCPGAGYLLPNQNSCTVNAADNEWHRLEVYIKRSTSVSDRTGVIRWWDNGNLCGNYDPAAGTGVNYGPGGIDYWNWNEGWTGTPSTQTKDWAHYLDHLYISQPQGATSVDTMPPGPVTSFTVTIPGGPPPPDPPPVGVSPGAEWFQFF